MHDPMVVAWEVPLPIPRRVRFADKRLAGLTGVRRRRGTGPKNAGQPLYPWWRASGYEGAVRGKALGLYRVATIWHVEPKGADSGTVCKHWEDGKPKKAWRWHVHHWRVQVHLLQQIRRYVFERCELCGRRYPWRYSPISHQWDHQRDGHWWNITAGAYHHECSSLVDARSTVEHDVAIFEALVAQSRVAEDLSEAEWVNLHLWGGNNGMDFYLRRRVWTSLGYDLDQDTSTLVKADA